MLGIRILDDLSNPKKQIEKEQELEDDDSKEKAWKELKKDMKKALKDNDHNSFVDSIVALIQGMVDKEEEDEDE